MLRGKQHPPQQVALGIFQRDFVPKVCDVSARRVRLPHRTHACSSFAAKLIELLRSQAALHFDVIHLRKVLPTLQHLSREVAVIGEKNQPRRGVFQASHRIDALRQAAQKIAQSLAAFGIGHGGHDFRRLVHQDVHAALFRSDHSARSFNAVGAGVGFGAQLGDHVAVHAHLTAGDELLCVAPRSDPRARDYFLQSFLHLGTSVRPTQNPIHSLTERLGHKRCVSRGPLHFAGLIRPSASHQTTLAARSYNKVLGFLQAHGSLKRCGQTYGPTISAPNARSPAEKSSNQRWNSSMENSPLAILLCMVTTGHTKPARESRAIAWLTPSIKVRSFRLSGFMGNTNVPFKSRKTARCFIYSGRLTPSLSWIPCLLYFSFILRLSRPCASRYRRRLLESPLLQLETESLLHRHSGTLPRALQCWSPARYRC